MQAKRDHWCNIPFPEFVTYLRYNKVPYILIEENWFQKSVRDFFYWNAQHLDLISQQCSKGKLKSSCNNGLLLYCKYTNWIDLFTSASKSKLTYFTHSMYFFWSSDCWQLLVSYILLVFFVQDQAMQQSSSQWDWIFL